MMSRDLVSCTQSTDRDLNTIAVLGTSWFTSLSHVCTSRWGYIQYSWLYTLNWCLCW